MDGTPLKISRPAAQPDHAPGFTVRPEPDGRHALIGPEGDVITVSKDFAALAEIRDNLNGRPRADLQAHRDARRGTVSRLVREAYGKSQPRPVTYVGNELNNRRVDDATSLPVLGGGQGVLA